MITHESMPIRYFRAHQGEPAVEHAVHQEDRPATDDLCRPLQDRHFARRLRAPVCAQPDEFGLDIEAFQGERAQQIGGEDEGAGQNRNRNFGAQWTFRNLARNRLHPPGDAGLRK